MLLSISEIIKRCETFTTDDEKVAWLQKCDTVALRTVLKYMYDPTVEFLLPNSAPPWKKNAYQGVEGMLYKEARRLKIFIRGGGYDTLDSVKRENLFISLLQDINNDDAELLVQMIQKIPFTFLPIDVISKSYSDLLTPGVSTNA